jgi:hypothetical protein
LLLHDAHWRFRQAPGIRSCVAAITTFFRDAIQLIKGPTIFGIVDRRDPLPGLLLCLRTIWQFMASVSRVATHTLRDRISHWTQYEQPGANLQH